MTIADLYDLTTEKQATIHKRYMELLVQPNVYCLPIYQKGEDYLKRAAMLTLDSMREADDELGVGVLPAHDESNTGIQYARQLFSALNDLQDAAVIGVLDTVFQHTDLCYELASLCDDVSDEPIDDSTTPSFARTREILDIEKIEQQYNIPQSIILRVIIIIMYAHGDDSAEDDQEIRQKITQLFIDHIKHLDGAKQNRNKRGQITKQERNKIKRKIKKQRRTLDLDDRPISKERLNELAASSFQTIYAIRIDDILSQRRNETANKKDKRWTQPHSYQTSSGLSASTLYSMIMSYSYLSQITDDPYALRTAIRLPEHYAGFVPYIIINLMRTHEQILYKLYRQDKTQKQPLISMLVEPLATNKKNDSNQMKTIYNVMMNEVVDTIVTQAFSADHPQLINNLLTSKEHGAILFKEQPSNFDAFIDDYCAILPHALASKMYKDEGGHNAEVIADQHISNLINKVHQRSVIISRSLGSKMNDQTKYIEQLDQKLDEQRQISERLTKELSDSHKKQNQLYDEIAKLKRATKQQETLQKEKERLSNQLNKKQKENKDLQQIIDDLLPRDTVSDVNEQNTKQVDDTQIIEQLSSKNIAVFGGHENWHNGLLKVLPDLRIVRAEHVNLDLSFIHNMDIAVINVATFNHSMYRKVQVQLKRQNKKVSVVYINSQSSNIPVTLRHIYANIDIGGHNA